MATSAVSVEESHIPFGALTPSLTPTTKFRRALRDGLVVFGIWTGLALLSASSMSLSRLQVNQDPEWTRSLVLNLTDHGIMAVFTCLILFMVRRWPLGAGRWRLAPIYLTVVTALGILKYLIYLPIRSYLYPELGAYRHPLLELCFYEYLELTAIVGVVHAVEYSRSLRESRLRASQLESRLSNARLEVLRSELQPHFLFNALHSISTLMHRDVEAADEMLEQLGDLLRLSLEKKAVQEVPLREELSILERYLNIARIRFGDRLTISVEVDPSVLDVPVPLFILQPLIENAIHHGIARRAGAERIAIRARGMDEAVEISISDDGPGLPADAVQEGIGLSNTRLRLEQLYGTAGRLALKGKPGSGAEAVLIIPRKRPESVRAP